MPPSQPTSAWLGLFGSIQIACTSAWMAGPTGRKVLLLNARRTPSPDGGPDSVLVAIEDVTELRRAEDDRRRVLDVLTGVGFQLYHPDLARPEVFAGLREFREHLGGELTIQMLRQLGEGFNVHEIDEATMARAIGRLRDEAAGVNASPAPDRELAAV